MSWYVVGHLLPPTTPHHPPHTALLLPPIRQQRYSAAAGSGVTPEEQFQAAGAQFGFRKPNAPRLAGMSSRRRDCHLMAPPCTCSRCFNRGKQGVSVK